MLSVILFAPNIACTIDKLQRFVTAACLQAAPRVTENGPEFVRRRMKEAGTFISSDPVMHLWSQLWAKQVVSWDMHLARDYARQLPALERPSGSSSSASTNVCSRSDQHDNSTTSWSSASALRFCNDAAWLASRRRFHARGRFSESFFSSTGTRNFRGRVGMRWERGIENAMNSLPPDERRGNRR